MKLLFSLFSAAIALTVQAQSELYPQHFNLEEVTLTDGPLKTAQDKNIETLLGYDTDRLLTPFIRQAGLSATTDKTNRYYDWENLHPNFANWGSPNFDLSGHVGGHYLTALALASAACHEATTKATLLKRIDYMLAVMNDCQRAFDADETGLCGFIGGQPMNASWQKLYQGDVAGFWKGAHPVPFYCEHKILAGLRDVAIYTDGPRASLAKDLFRKLCDWSVNVVGKLNEQQMQGVLGNEHGGMNEVLADAYCLFGDPKYLDGAKKYSHKTMIAGMQTPDPKFLDNRHANTQVPKYIGFLRINQLHPEGTDDYCAAARNFFTDVSTRRTVCIGGNSVGEHFLSVPNCTRYISELDGPESCNTNNMMKLSEDLFDSFHEGRYVDFYEAALYNHILSTQDPVTGGYVYFTPLRPQSYRIYSKLNQDMWCCVGTGMENHSKYGHFVYTHQGKTLFVNLFVPSILRSKDFAVTQTTHFPYAPSTRLTIDKGGRFTLAIRRPSWVAEGFGVKVNGKAVDVEPLKSGQYVMLDRRFKKGDVVEVALPMALRYEECPNQSDYIAFKYGPILLGARTTKVQAGDEGNLKYEPLAHEYALGERMGHAPGAYTAKQDVSKSPMLIGNRADVLSRITPVDNQPLTFTLDVSRHDASSEGYPWTTLTLQPYYSLHHSRVSNYFYQQTYEGYLNSSWVQAEQEAKRLDVRTIDKVDVGKQQEEAGVMSFSEGSSKGSYKDEDYRDTKAGGWMQVVLTDSIGAKNLSLMLRFQGDDKGRKCKIMVNDALLLDYCVPEKPQGANAANFFNLELPLGPLALDEKGKPQTRFVVKLVADEGTKTPGLYYIRLMSNE